MTKRIQKIQSRINNQKSILDKFKMEHVQAVGGRRPDGINIQDWKVLCKAWYSYQALKLKAQKLLCRAGFKSDFKPYIPVVVEEVKKNRNWSLVQNHKKPKVKKPASERTKLTLDAVHVAQSCAAYVNAWAYIPFTFEVSATRPKRKRSRFVGGKSVFSAQLNDYELYNVKLALKGTRCSFAFRKYMIGHDLTNAGDKGVISCAPNQPMWAKLVKSTLLWTSKKPVTSNWIRLGDSSISSSDNTNGGSMRLRDSIQYQINVLKKAVKAQGSEKMDLKGLFSRKPKCAISTVEERIQKRFGCAEDIFAWMTEQGVDINEVKHFRFWNNRLKEYFDRKEDKYQTVINLLEQQLKELRWASERPANYSTEAKDLSSLQYRALREIETLDFDKKLRYRPTQELIAKAESYGLTVRGNQVVIPTLGDEDVKEVLPGLPMSMFLRNDGKIWNKGLPLAACKEMQQMIDFYEDNKTGMFRWVSKTWGGAVLPMLYHYFGVDALRAEATWSSTNTWYTYQSHQRGVQTYIVDFTKRDWIDKLPHGAIRNRELLEMFLGSRDTEVDGSILMGTLAAPTYRPDFPIQVRCMPMVDKGTINVWENYGDKIDNATSVEEFNKLSDGACKNYQILLDKMRTPKADHGYVLKCLGVILRNNVIAPDVILADLNAVKGRSAGTIEDIVAQEDVYHTLPLAVSMMHDYSIGSLSVSWQVLLYALAKMELRYVSLWSVKTDEHGNQVPSTKEECFMEDFGGRGAISRIFNSLDDAIDAIDHGTESAEAVDLMQRLIDAADDESNDADLLVRLAWALRNNATYGNEIRDNVRNLICANKFMFQTQGMALTGDVAARKRYLIDWNDPFPGQANTSGYKTDDMGRVDFQMGEHKTKAILCVINDDTFWSAYGEDAKYAPVILFRHPVSNWGGVGPAIALNPWHIKVGDTYLAQVMPKSIGATSKAIKWILTGDTDGDTAGYIPLGLGVEKDGDGFKVPELHTYYEDYHFLYSFSKVGYELPKYMHTDGSVTDQPINVEKMMASAKKLKLPLHMGISEQYTSISDSIIGSGALLQGLSMRSYEAVATKTAEIPYALYNQVLVTYYQIQASLLESGISAQKKNVTDQIVALINHAFFDIAIPGEGTVIKENNIGSAYKPVLAAMLTGQHIDMDEPSLELYAGAKRISLKHMRQGVYRMFNTAPGVYTQEEAYDLYKKAHADAAAMFEDKKELGKYRRELYKLRNDLTNQNFFDVWSCAFNGKQLDLSKGVSEFNPSFCLDLCALISFSCPHLNWFNNTRLVDMSKFKNEEGISPEFKWGIYGESGLNDALARWVQISDARIKNIRTRIDSWFKWVEFKGNDARFVSWRRMFPYESTQDLVPHVNFTETYGPETMGEIGNCLMNRYLWSRFSFKTTGTPLVASQYPNMDLRRIFREASLDTDNPLEIWYYYAQIKYLAGNEKFIGENIIKHIRVLFQKYGRNGFLRKCRSNDPAREWAMEFAALHKDSVAYNWWSCGVEHLSQATDKADQYRQEFINTWYQVAKIMFNTAPTMSLNVLNSIAWDAHYEDNAPLNVVHLIESLYIWNFEFNQKHGNNYDDHFGCNVGCQDVDLIKCCQSLRQNEATREVMAGFRQNVRDYLEQWPATFRMALWQIAHDKTRLLAVMTKAGFPTEYLFAPFRKHNRYQEHEGGLCNKTTTTRVRLGFGRCNIENKMTIVMFSKDHPNGISSHWKNKSKKGWQMGSVSCSDTAIWALDAIKEVGLNKSNTVGQQTAPVEVILNQALLTNGETQFEVYGKPAYRKANLNFGNSVATELHAVSLHRTSDNACIGLICRDPNAARMILGFDKAVITVKCDENGGLVIPKIDWSKRWNKVSGWFLNALEQNGCNGQIVHATIECSNNDTDLYDERVEIDTAWWHNKTNYHKLEEVMNNHDFICEDGVWRKEVYAFGEDMVVEVRLADDEINWNFVPVDEISKIKADHNYKMGLAKAVSKRHAKRNS